MGPASICGIPVNLSNPNGRRSPAIENEKQEVKRDDYFELKFW